MMTAKDIWTDTKFDTWFKDGTAFILDVQWARDSFFKTLNAYMGHGKKDRSFDNWFKYRCEEEYEAIIYLIRKDLENGNELDSFKKTFGGNINYFKNQYKKTDKRIDMKGDKLFSKVMVDILTKKIDVNR